MITLTQQAKEAVNRLIEAFDTPDGLVDTLAKASLIPNNSPCVKWGPYNRLLVALHGTSDARGFRQWREVNRYVKKGAKAMHILVPRFKKIEAEKSADAPEDDDDKQGLIGFVSAAVFAVENTDGEALPECSPRQLPKLQEIADRLGIPVKYAGAVSNAIAGVYSHEKGDSTGASGRITLYSLDLSVFYHELSHALHHRSGKIREGGDAGGKRDNEVVAEVSAAVLVKLFEGEEMGKQALAYLKDYGATKARLLKLLPEIVEVVDLAINFAA